MTPTLRGRWQTRLFLLLTAGAVITSFFGVLYEDFQAVFGILGYMLGLGLVWDVVYNFLQSFRWDRDWSPALYVLTGIWEAVILYVLIKTPGLPGIPEELGLLKFMFHFWAVWLVAFLLMFGPMRILFPRWRFRGGQWL